MNNNETQKRLTKGQAIRAKCLDCCCWQNTEVRECTVKKCPLWRYRMGKEIKDSLTPIITPKEKTP